MMNSDILKNRTRLFSIHVGKLVLELQYNILNKNYANQITRSSSSVGANYRAACRAKSTADFINKLKIVEEELDEFNPDKTNTIKLLLKEANELLSIIVASLNTLKTKQQSLTQNRKS